MKQYNLNGKFSLFTISLFTIFLFTIFSFTSCKKEPSFIGMEILPTGDIVDAGIKEYYLKIMNVYKDPVRTDGPNESSFGIIGCYRDVFMGETIADFVTEVSIPLGIEIFKRSVAFSPDSLVLCLAYSKNSWCGDTLQNINFKIYELNERLEPAGKYFSDKVVDYKPVLLAEKMVSPRNGITDSIWNLSSYENILRFNLSDPDNTILNKIFNLTENNLSHRDSFKNVLNGFYITCDIPDKTGALFNMNLRSSNSNLKFFYTKELKDYITGEIYGYERDSVLFPINRESRMFNRFTHNNNLISFNDETVPRIFIQGMAGSFAKIDMTDFIQAWRDSISNKGNYDFSFSGISIEFSADSLKDEQGLYIERQSYLALYEEDENGDFILPTFVNNSNITLYSFHSIEFSSGSANSYATYNSSTRKFTFRMYPEYFDKLVRAKCEDENCTHSDENCPLWVKPIYLRSINSSFNFRRQILLNTPDMRPKITIMYVKYK